MPIDVRRIKALKADGMSHRAAAKEMNVPVHIIQYYVDKMQQQTGVKLHKGQGKKASGHHLQGVWR